MDNRLFREKSAERLTSPEQLNDYLQVTNPGIWIALVAVIFLLTSLFVWSWFTSVESFAVGIAQARGGALTITFYDAQTAQNVEPGMTVSIGDLRSAVTYVGTDEDGRVIAISTAMLPDGAYEAKVGYRRTQIFRMLFN